MDPHPRRLLTTQWRSLLEAKKVDGPVTGLEDFQLSFNNNEGLMEVTYSGKLTAGTTNLNHIIYRASDSNSGAILDYILLPEDINSDGSFSITNNNHLLPGNLTPSQLSEQELVIVASDGSVIGYKPDAVTGNFVEVPNGFTNNYSTYNFTEDFYGLAERPDYESLSKTLNISSLYGLPGETINIDVDHLNPSINSQISFADMRYHGKTG